MPRTQLAFDKIIRDNPSARKMKVRDFQLLVGDLSVMIAIKQGYQAEWRARKAARGWKRKHGICGGRPGCMTVTGPDKHSCNACLHAAYNPKGTRKLAEYGKRRRAEQDTK